MRLALSDSNQHYPGRCIHAASQSENPLNQTKMEYTTGLQIIFIVVEAVDYFVF